MRLSVEPDFEIYDARTQMKRAQIVADIVRGDGVNDSNLYMSIHTGTHIDAPLHHFENGDAADTVALDVVVADAWEVSIPDLEVFPRVSFDSLF